MATASRTRQVERAKEFVRYLNSIDLEATIHLFVGDVTVRVEEYISNKEDVDIWYFLDRSFKPGVLWRQINRGHRCTEWIFPFMSKEGLKRKLKAVRRDRS